MTNMLDLLVSFLSSLWGPPSSDLVALWGWMCGTRFGSPLGDVLVIAVPLFVVLSVAVVMFAKRRVS